MTPSDVVHYSNVKLPFNPCTFRELYSIEYAEARTCLGFEFWEALISSLADYSDEVQYAEGKDYVLDDIVRFEGIAYKAKKATSNPPTYTEDWAHAPKFTSDCAGAYDELFCNHLAPYLSHRILALRLPYIWSKIKDIGVVEFNGQSMNTSDESVYDRLLNAVHRDRIVAWSNLQHYLDASKDNDCFDLYFSTENQCDCGCGNAKGQCKQQQRTPGGYNFG